MTSRPYLISHTCGNAFPDRHCQDTVQFKKSSCEVTKTTARSNQKQHPMQTWARSKQCHGGNEALEMVYTHSRKVLTPAHIIHGQLLYNYFKYGPHPLFLVLALRFFVQTSTANYPSFLNDFFHLKSTSKTAAGHFHNIPGKIIEFSTLIACFHMWKFWCCHSICITLNILFAIFSGRKAGLYHSRQCGQLMSFVIELYRVMQNEI